MKYLLDTNICIYIIKRKPEKVLRKFAALTPGDVCISAITLYELSYGAYKSQAIEKNIAAIQQFSSPLELLPFDAQDSGVCGQIRASLEKSGQVIGPLDLQIAAQAIAKGLTLVTNNIREFQRVPNIQLENWNE